MMKDANKCRPRNTNYAHYFPQADKITESFSFSIPLFGTEED